VWACRWAPWDAARRPWRPCRCARHARTRSHQQCYNNQLQVLNTAKQQQAVKRHTNAWAGGSGRERKVLHVFTGEELNVSLPFGLSYAHSDLGLCPLSSWLCSCASHQEALSVAAAQPGGGGGARAAAQRELGEALLQVINNSEQAP
jgi:hypothetical protein